MNYYNYELQSCDFSRYRHLSRILTLQGGAITDEAKQELEDAMVELYGCSNCKHAIKLECQLDDERTTEDHLCTLWDFGGNEE